MIVRPYPVAGNKCSPNVPVEKYRPPRVTIGSDTRTIAVNLDRNAPHSTQQIFPILEFSKKDHPDFTFDLFEYKNGIAYFTVDSSKVETAGLYQARVKVGECYVGTVEVVFAPSWFVAGVEALASSCADSDWQEPECKDACEQSAECEPCPSTVDCDSGCDTPSNCEPLDDSCNKINLVHGYES